MTTLETVAGLLNVNPSWLWALIQFESGGNPAARNPISGARGLIQFMHSTARAMGFKDADDLVNQYPTFDSQLTTPVYNYLKQWAPFPTKQSLYMSVFYPVARTWAPDTVFPDAVRKANPKIDTVQDYINFVEKTPTKKKIEIAGITVFAAAAITTLFMALTQKGKK